MADVRGRWALESSLVLHQRRRIATESCPSRAHPGLVGIVAGAVERPCRRARRWAPLALAGGGGCWRPAAGVVEIALPESVPYPEEGDDSELGRQPIPAGDAVELLSDRCNEPRDDVARQWPPLGRALTHTNTAPPCSRDPNSDDRATRRPPTAP